MVCNLVVLLPVQQLLPSVAERLEHAPSQGGVVRHRRFVEVLAAKAHLGVALHEEDARDAQLVVALEEIGVEVLLRKVVVVSAMVQVRAGPGQNGRAADGEPPLAAEGLLFLQRRVRF